MQRVFCLVAFAILVAFAGDLRAQTTNSISAQASQQAECSRQAGKIVSIAKRQVYIKHCMRAAGSYARERSFVEPR